MTIADFLTRLDAVKGSAPHWTARCPAHEDTMPSLSVTEKADCILLKCHAGCSAEAVISALGLRMADLFAEPAVSSKEIIATYDYVDANGVLLYQVVRYHPKDFRQRRPDGAGDWTWNLKGVERVLYHLPQICKAVASGKRVFIVEGEKDVHSVEGAGFTATTCPGGAGKWRPEYTEVLQGANVVVVADRDEPGYNHANQVAKALEGIAKRVVVVEPLEGKDVSEHLAAGRSLRELVPVQLIGADTASERNARIREAALATLSETRQQVGSWGWGDVDRLCGALVAGWLYVIGARPSNGKTTLLLNLLSSLREDRIPTLYFGTEMLAEDLVKKWAALRLGLDELRVFENELSDEERHALEREIIYVTEAQEVTFSTAPRLDLKQLVSEVEWAFDARTGPPPRVVILDHLHRMTQDREELEQLARELKDIATERRVAMIVAAQLNREKDLGPFDLYTPPSLARYKGSAAIEENADVCIGLFRPLRPGMTMSQRRAVQHGEYPVTEFVEPNTMGIVCLKHRFRGAAVGRFVSLVVSGSRLESKYFTGAVPPAGAGDAWKLEDEDAVPF